MSEAQALNTETEIEIVEDDATEVVAVDLEAVETDQPTETESEAIEIAVDEAGKPPARRLSGFEKRLRKKDERVTQAEARAQALEEENKLLRMAQEQKSNTLEEPDEDTFDGSPDEFKAAQRAYNQQEIARIAAEQAQALIESQQQDSTQAQIDLQIEETVSEYYKRADSLNVKNFDQLEGNATDLLGEQFIKTIIASTDQAHRIIASMGAAPGKTAQIARLAKTNPAKAFADALLFEINPALKPASLETTPDPESVVDPGAGVTSTVPGLAGAKFE